MENQDGVNCSDTTRAGSLGAALLTGEQGNNFQYGFFDAIGGVRLRYGIWRCSSNESRGTLLLLGGRKEFLEKYSEVAARLNNRGLDVFSMDWRGQGLSDRILDDRLKGHVADFEEYLKDLHLYFSRVVAPECRHPSVTILAHSMGAHIALRFMHDFPGMVHQCVLTAPMIDIRANPFSKAAMRWLSARAFRKGYLEKFVPGAKGGTLVHQAFSGNLLTTDKQRFLRGLRQVSANRQLALGGVTYGWLAAALRSIDILLSPGYLTKIQAPVLLVAAGKEMVVSKTAQRRACERLPDCRLVAIPDARHEILMERDDLQEIFWNAFDRFMGEMRNNQGTLPGAGDQ